MDVFIARQPIFDAHQNVIAYELLYRDTEKNYFNSAVAANVATSILLINSYLNFGIENLVENERAFINFGKSLIDEQIPHLLKKERVVIELTEDIVPDAFFIQEIKNLKKIGYMIALDDYVEDFPHKELVALADIIKVDFIENTDLQIRKIAGQFRDEPHILLAEKVETQEQFNWAKRIGFEFFQGYFFSKPIMTKGKKLSPMAYQLMTIFEALNRSEPNYKEIAELIESDVTLTVKLLRLVNSSFSLVNDISSVVHALSILGIDAFRKWLSLAMIEKLSVNKPSEIVKVAMYRLKFLESLAQHSKFNMFENEMKLIGILSVIDVLLEQPMEVVLERLSLATLIKDTLLMKNTIFSDLYHIALAYEKGHFDEAQILCQHTSINFQLFPKLYVDAIKWADELYHFMQTETSSQTAFDEDIS